MSAGRYDISAEQYASFALPLTWQDASGATMDLTGYTGLMQVRDGAGALVIELSTENGRITIGAGAPNISLAVAAADMAALSSAGAQGWVYDLLVTSPAPANFTTRLIAGNFTVNPGVSHA